MAVSTQINVFWNLKKGQTSLNGSQKESLLVSVHHLTDCPSEFDGPAE